jgi:hypothetical protein
MQIRGTGTREISASITKPSVDSTVSDVDYYEVNLSDGDEVRVQARNLFRGANLSLELIGPGGRTERSFFEWRARGQASMTATRDGSHYVKVSAVSINQTEARYRLDITKDTRLGPENVDFDVVPENNSGGLQLGGVDFWDDDWVVVDTMPDQTQAPCTLDETKEYKRSPSVSISTDTKINRTRVVQVGSQQPCKVVVRTSGPSNAEVDIFVTLDGSQPTLSNYDASSQTSGSDEQIVLEPADGLRAGGTVTALARGYPVTGDYAVQVEIYRRSE